MPEEQKSEPNRSGDAGTRGHTGKRAAKEVRIMLPADAKANLDTLKIFADECLVPILVEEFLREQGLRPKIAGTDCCDPKKS